MKSIIKKGNIITAKVTGIEKYGIFVKTNDNYNGLIHISEISYKYVGNVNKYASIGDIIKVKIIEVQEEKKRLILSIKDIKKNNPKLNEKGSGFDILKNKLNNWIDKY